MLPKNAELWLPDLIRHRLWRRPGLGERVYVYFCLTDHFEPGWRGAEPALQRERVRAWVEKYPVLAGRHQDSAGRPPQHSFFFPEEQYQPDHLEVLASLCRQGWGSVEVHLHHDGDTAAGLREKLERFIEILHHRHGLLRRDAAGRIRYGFIHGNYALNNSLPNGRWCGVNDETSILLETGCYADFTMPCAPWPAQTRKVNSIYYALPRPVPRAHDWGPDAVAGQPSPPGLLMIQGPLSLNWGSQKWGILPRIDIAEISAVCPPGAGRVRLWIEEQVHVRGAADHVFVKVSTHGAQDANARALLEGGLGQMWSALEHICAPDRGFELRYVNAYEMYLRIKELEAA